MALHQTTERLETGDGGRGSALDRIDALERANHASHDPERDRELLGLRHQAFADAGRSPSAPWPPPGSEQGKGGGPSELSADELSPESVAAGVFGHGSVIVRGLIPRDDTERLVEGIERARAAQAAHFDGDKGTDPEYFSLFKPGPGHQMGPRWARHGGGVLSADSPRMFHEVLDTFERAGVRPLVNGYFGERPAASAQKGTLRRTSPDGNNGWHQDGSFMGLDIRSLNMWTALSTCGDDAPSLDIVPRRFDELVGTGTHGAYFDWTVGPGKVDELLGGAAPWHPHFEPGDVIFFDELCLHRTGLREGMTRPRWAIENWFFAPSAYPSGQVPLIW